MDYKTFNKYITQLRQLKKDEENLNKALKIFEPDFNYVCFSRYEMLVVKLLEEAMGDTENDWIGYWLYELDCGKEATRTSAMVDGKYIPIKTVRNLYNLLTKKR